MQQREGGVAEAWGRCVRRIGGWDDSEQLRAAA